MTRHRLLPRPPRSRRRERVAGRSARDRPWRTIVRAHPPGQAGLSLKMSSACPDERAAAREDPGQGDTPGKRAATAFAPWATQSRLPDLPRADHGRCGSVCSGPGTQGRAVPPPRPVAAWPSATPAQPRSGACRTSASVPLPTSSAWRKLVSRMLPSTKASTQRRRVEVDLAHEIAGDAEADHDDHLDHVVGQACRRRSRRTR